MGAALLRAPCLVLNPCMRGNSRQVLVGLLVLVALLDPSSALGKRERNSRSASVQIILVKTRRLRVSYFRGPEGLAPRALLG